MLVFSNLRGVVDFLSLSIARALDAEVALVGMLHFYFLSKLVETVDLTWTAGNKFFPLLNCHLLVYLFLVNGDNRLFVHDASSYRGPLSVLFADSLAHKEPHGHLLIFTQLHNVYSFLRGSCLHVDICHRLDGQFLVDWEDVISGDIVWL